MTRNESAAISVLKGILRDSAASRGGHFSEYPLGPQDRKVLADDIFQTADYFAIVESKWSEGQLASEGQQKSERVRRLCKGLASNKRMAELHEKCHKISWRDSATELTMLQSYREVVCRQSFPSTCSSHKQLPALDADLFADEFFGTPPGHCIPASDFADYVDWLVQVITGSNQEVTVLARQTNAQGKSTSKAISIADLAAHATHLRTRR